MLGYVGGAKETLEVYEASVQEVRSFIPRFRVC